MKALIFNSGLGKRMGNMTKDRPKSMVCLKNGETIFERQIRILEDVGLNEFIITTGPYPDQLEQIANRHPDSKFTFVHNPLYNTTNCIYSFYLASQYLDDDVITLHGDLVFSKKTVKHILNDSHESCVTVDPSKPLPEKDFKCRIENGRVTCISVNIFDANCISLQPMYKVSRKDMDKWIISIKQLINSGQWNIYAEEAFNSISYDLFLYPLTCKGYYIEEIDNIEDYARVSSEIALVDVKEQNVLRKVSELKNYIKHSKYKRPLLVASNRTLSLPLVKEIGRNCDPVFFSGFSNNPQYEEALNGMHIFQEKKCDSIISIGGGSAMDTAKCILAFSMTSDGKYMDGKREYRFIPHMAIPTTAGTGSESTRYATIYRSGKKYSVAGYDEIPQTIVLLPNLLQTMPPTVKTSTLLDALCQCIESIWSINATEESRSYALKGISLILDNIDDYYKNKSKATYNIQNASNLSGRAINIAQTTAAHAMSYVLTSKMKIPHGIAVTRCIIPLWKIMISKKNDERIYNSLSMIDSAFCSKQHESTLLSFESLVKSHINLEPLKLTTSQCEEYAQSINIQRLANFPIELSNSDIIDIYYKL